MKKIEKLSDETEPTPICEKCGNAMVFESDEWLCPHCQGEIDFFGEDEKLD